MERKERQEAKEKVRQVVKESIEALRQCNPEERIREAAERMQNQPRWKVNEEVARVTKQFEQEWSSCLTVSNTS